MTLASDRGGGGPSDRVPKAVGRDGASDGIESPYTHLGLVGGVICREGGQRELDKGNYHIRFSKRWTEVSPPQRLAAS